MPTLEFRGRNETDIEVQLREWMAANVGKVRNVRRGPIRHDLSITAKSPVPRYGRITASSFDDTHSMVVEYDVVEPKK